MTRVGRSDYIRERIGDQEEKRRRKKQRSRRKGGGLRQEG